MPSDVTVSSENESFASDFAVPGIDRVPIDRGDCTRYFLSCTVHISERLLLRPMLQQSTLLQNRSLAIFDPWCWLRGSERSLYTNVDVCLHSASTVTEVFSSISC